MWLRFPIEVANPVEVLARAKSQNIILGDWYRTPIAPADASQTKAHYQAKSCSVAESLGQGIVNLPTEPALTAQDLNRIIGLFS